MASTSEEQQGSAGNDDENHPLETLMDKAAEEAEDGDELTIGGLLDAFGSRGFGPIITIFALVAMIPPIGGIPLVPTTMGVLIFLVSIQLVFGKQHPWVPNFLEKRGVSRDKVDKTKDKAVGILRKIDSLIGPRMKWATGPVPQRLAAVACCILAMCMPPLELLPFAAAAPAAGVVLFGVGLTARDGLLMIIGSIAFVAVLALLGPQALSMLSSGGSGGG